VLISFQLISMHSGRDKLNVVNTSISIHISLIAFRLYEKEVPDIIRKFSGVRSLYYLQLP
jgi:hypothetical protein